MQTASSAMAKAVFVLTLGFVGNSRSWVFTDVSYPPQSVLTNEISPDGSGLTAEEYDAILAEGRLNLIYPGTKWCGPGDIAEGPADLGPSAEADSCCREHDWCPDIMAGGTTKNNLTNDAFYTRLNCVCDYRFRDCLRAANTTTASRVGVIYFDVISQKCYRKDFPVTSCLKRTGILRRKCVEYSYDTNGEKLYQWFDVPSY